MSLINLGSLVGDCLRHIVSYLDSPKDFFSLSYCCRHFSEEIHQSPFRSYYHIPFSLSWEFFRDAARAREKEDPSSRRFSFVEFLKLDVRGVDSDEAVDWILDRFPRLHTLQVFSSEDVVHSWTEPSPREESVAVRILRHLKERKLITRVIDDEESRVLEDWLNCSGFADRKWGIPDLAAVRVSERVYCGHDHTDFGSLHLSELITLLQRERQNAEELRNQFSEALICRALRAVFLLKDPEEALDVFAKILKSNLSTRSCSGFALYLEWVIKDYELAEIFHRLATWRRQWARMGRGETPTDLSNSLVSERTVDRGPFEKIPDLETDREGTGVRDVETYFYFPGGDNSLETFLDYYADFVSRVRKDSEREMLLRATSMESAMWT